VSNLSDPDTAAFRELARRIEPAATFRRAWRLSGGVSAEVTVIELERRGGDLTRLLARRHGVADRTRNPHIARDEFALLEVAQAHGLTAPRPVYLDESGTLFPTPVLVLEYVEGETDFAPDDLPGYLTRAAGELAMIHRVRVPAALSFLPRQDWGLGPRPALLDDSLGEGRIRDALAAIGPAAPVNPTALLHGDYWPGNLLWRDGKLVAVIDWEDARLGDPLSDLGNSRLEFLWAFGLEAMAELTRRYLNETTVDTTNLPYWDLRAALRPCGKLAAWGLHPDAEQRMRARYAWFVDQALARLPAP
jgi:aminoglycoside phosphotransferase (APT) family kinase protein